MVVGLALKAACIAGFKFSARTSSNDVVLILTGAMCFPLTG